MAEACLWFATPPTFYIGMFRSKVMSGRLMWVSLGCGTLALTCFTDLDDLVNVATLDVCDPVSIHKAVAKLAESRLTATFVIRCFGYSVEAALAKCCKLAVSDVEVAKTLVKLAVYQQIFGR